MARAHCDVLTISSCIERDLPVRFGGLCRGSRGGGVCGGSWCGSNSNGSRGGGDRGSGSTTKTATVGHDRGGTTSGLLTEGAAKRKLQKDASGRS